MTSPKQITANQRNAQQSTGPRSPAGKGGSRANAARHGLTATTVLLPGEDHEEFDEHRQLLLADLQPVGAVEMLLAERVVVAALQLRRHTAMESSLLHFLVLTARAAIAKEETAEMSDFDLQGLMAPYGKGKEYAEAVTRAELATHASRGDDALLGRAIDLGVTRGDALAPQRLPIGTGWSSGFGTSISCGRSWPSRTRGRNLALLTEVTPRYSNCVTRLERGIDGYPTRRFVTPAHIETSARGATSRRGKRRLLCSTAKRMSQ